MLKEGAATGLGTVAARRVADARLMGRRALQKIDFPLIFSRKIFGILVVGLALFPPIVCHFNGLSLWLLCLFPDAYAIAWRIERYRACFLDMPPQTPHLTDPVYQVAVRMVPAIYCWRGLLCRADLLCLPRGGRSASAPGAATRVNLTAVGSGAGDCRWSGSWSAVAMVRVWATWTLGGLWSTGKFETIFLAA